MKFLEKSVLNHVIENSHETHSLSSLQLKFGCNKETIEKIVEEFVKCGIFVKRNSLYCLIIAL